VVFPFWGEKGVAFTGLTAGDTRVVGWEQIIPGWGQTNMFGLFTTQQFVIDLKVPIRLY
jgi:hypothetical protein